MTSCAEDFEKIKVIKMDKKLPSDTGIKLMTSKSVNEIHLLLKKIEKRLENIEDKLEKHDKVLDVFKKEKDIVGRAPLTERESEIYKMILERDEMGLEPLGVFEVAEQRGVSYAAAHKLIDRLIRKGFITSRTEKKGRKKRLYLRTKDYDRQLYDEGIAID